MFWLRAKDINDAINKVAERIEAKIKMEDVQSAITGKVERVVYDVLLKSGVLHRYTENSSGLRSMFHEVLEREVSKLTQKVIEKYENEVLASLTKKEIRQLVEQGIKEKIKNSLSDGH